MTGTKLQRWGKTVGGLCIGAGALASLYGVFGVIFGIFATAFLPRLRVPPDAAPVFGMWREIGRLWLFHGPGTLALGVILIVAGIGLLRGRATAIRWALVGCVGLVVAMVAYTVHLLSGARPAMAALFADHPMMSLPAIQAIGGFEGYLRLSALGTLGMIALPLAALALAVLSLRAPASPA